MPEDRLDRIERLQEQNAVAISQLTVDIAATNIEMRGNFAALTEVIKESNARVDAKFEEVAVALKEMAQAQTAMLRTMDRLAQLWERSSN